MNQRNYFAAALHVTLAAMVACSAPPPAADATGPIRLIGDVEHPTAWNVSSLEQRFADDVTHVEHVTRGGDRIRLRAVPLRALLEASAPVVEADRKNPELSLAVVLRARDGYVVTYAYEEVVPYKSDDVFFLAFAGEDGPLPEELMPARVVKLGEGNSSRVPRGIIEIEVVDLARPQQTRSGVASDPELSPE